MEARWHALRKSIRGKIGVTIGIGEILSKKIDEIEVIGLMDAFR